MRHRLARASAALALMGSFVMLPLAIDQCAATCEASRHAMPAPDPVCRPGALQSAQLTPVPGICGRDHSTGEAVTVAVAGSDRSSRALVAWLAPVVAPSIVEFAPTRGEDLDIDTPPPLTAARLLSSSLRI